MAVIFLLNHKNFALLCLIIFAIVLTIIEIVAAYVCGSRRFSIIWRMCASSFGKWPLFVVIVIWVLFALLVFTVLGWLWGGGGYWSWQRWLTNWRSVGTEVAPLELVKISLTTIGGRSSLLVWCSFGQVVMAGRAGRPPAPALLSAWSMSVRCRSEVWDRYRRSPYCHSSLL